MAIFICQKCLFIKEVNNQALVGKTAKCPACQQPGQSIQDTKELLKALLEQTSQLQTDMAKLKQQMSLAAISQTNAIQNASKPTSSSPTPVPSGYAFANISSAPELTNYKGVIQWFERKQLKVTYDETAMDIAGYFDEIAVKLGDNYSVLKWLLDKIKYHQRKNHKRFSLNLLDFSQANIGVIKQFCRELYESAFLSRYYVEQDKKTISLTLQADHKIVNFFNGVWFEWFVFMKVATLLVNHQRSFSCLKNFLIQFANGDKHEIDLFFLIDDSLPLWLECKSGEFRDDIPKYTKLRNTLKLDKNQLWLVSLGLPDEQATGLTGTFELTIVNEKTMLTTLTGLLSKLSPPPAKRQDKPGKTIKSEEKSGGLWSGIRQNQ